MNKLAVVFTPDLSDGTWTLHVTSDHAAFRLPGLEIGGGKVTGLGRPKLEELNSRMLVAHTGFIVRVQLDGAITISATGRSAFVVHAWLVETIEEGR